MQHQHHHQLRVTLLAAALTWVAGCGKVDTFIDAGGDDGGGTDSVTLDAPATGTVNVITEVKCCGNPGPHQGGVDVFVTGPDGTIGDTATTNASGQATVDVTGGDSVTVVYPVDANNNRYLSTIVGVGPGETLTFGDRPSWDYTVVGSPMTIAWAAAPNAGGYDVNVSCGYVQSFNGDSAIVVHYAYCANDPLDYVVFSRDLATNAYTYAGHGSTTWVDNGQAPWLTLAPVTSATVAATGIPATVDYANIELDHLYNRAYSGSAYVGGAPVGGSLSGSGVVAAGANAAMAYYGFSRNNFGYQSGSERLTSAPATYTFASPPLLPWLGPAVVNAAAHQATWIYDDAGADPADVLVVDFAWSHTLPSSATVYSDWQLYLPPSTPGDVRLTEFPPALADVLTDADPIYVNHLYYVESDDVAGWGPTHTRPEWQIQCPNCTDGSSTTPPKTRYSNSNQGGD